MVCFSPVPKEEKLLKEKPWNIWDLIFIYAISAVFAFPLADGVLTQIGPWLTGQSGAEVESLLFFLRYLFYFTIVMAVILMVVLKIRRGSWQDLGLRSISFKNLLVYGLGAGLGIVTIILILGIAMQMLQPEVPPQAIEEVLRAAKRPEEILFIVLAAVFLAPMVEELFYRGMIYPYLRNHFGILGGSLISGLIFGLAHWDLWRALPLAIGGVLLCWIYEKSGSLWASICAHGVWNGVITYIVVINYYFTI
jgi:membrane protease YdiL (CAAX protease family)